MRFSDYVLYGLIAFFVLRWAFHKLMDDPYRRR